MECDKFEAAMVDELSGELGEVAAAALRKHLSGCARCAATFSHLRAASPMASSGPLVEPPVSLQGQIFEPLGFPLPGALRSKEGSPSSPAFGHRFAAVVSVAGGWAMRPETAMAALFLFMTGTSVLLLRGKSSHAPVNAEITVTEEGTPAPWAPSNAFSPPASSPAAQPPAAGPAAATAGALHPSGRPAAAPLPPPAAPRSAPSSDDGRAGSKTPPSPPLPAPLAQSGGLPQAPAPTRSATLAREDPSGATAALAAADGDGAESAPSPAASPDSSAAYASAFGAYRSGRFGDARRAFDALAPGDAVAGLWAARAVREERGCGAAIPRFDEVAQRAASTTPGWDALFEGGRCRVSLGDYAGARQRFETLAAVASFHDRAQAELERLRRIQQGRARP